MTFPALTHYAAEPVTLDRTRTYDDHMIGLKPGGFWVSIDSDYGWAAWCRDNDFGGERLAVVHDVHLRPDAHVLLVDTDAKLVALAETYRAPRMPQMPESRFNRGIDWRAVRDQYQGLIIAPYQWNRRLDMEFFWYYGWDCASGAIWDLEVIESIQAR